jgi:hypothetical protein
MFVQLLQAGVDPAALSSIFPNARPVDDDLFDLLALVNVTSPELKTIK